jgi:molecular chaperone GrpE
MEKELEREGNGEESEAVESERSVESPEEEQAVAAGGAEELQASLEKAEGQAEDLRDKWMRARADLANYRRRAEQEREEVAKFGTVLLLSRILPIIDDLERALQTVPREMMGFTWLNGIVLIQRKLQAILEVEGVREIVTEGVNFDPNLHEAVLYQESSEHGEGYILEELQKGYLLHDRILRPALVKVARAVEKKPEEIEEVEAKPEERAGNGD